jgi:hypothetical protein
MRLLRHQARLKRQIRLGTTSPRYERGSLFSHVSAGNEEFETVLHRVTSDSGSVPLNSAGESVKDISQAERRWSLSSKIHQRLQLC